MKIHDCLAYLGTTQWHRLAILLFLVLLGVGYGVGFSVAIQNAQTASDDDYARYLSIFTEWQMEITATFTKASSLAASLGAYVTSSADVPMNYALQLQSGGVISQSYPPNQAPIGLDVLRQASDLVTYETMIRTGEPISVGPAPIAQGGIGIFIRYPVFTSEIKNLSTFWGAGNVVIRIVDLLHALNITDLPIYDHINYVMWYSTYPTNATNSDALAADPLYNPTIVTTSASSDAESGDVMRSGMRMKLPISEPGKTSYIAIYPIGGPMSNTIHTDLAVLIIFVVLAGAILVVSMLYAALFLAFLYRHRHAPDTDVMSKGNVFIAALTLRSAQPIVERAPLESVRMFNEFFRRVQSASIAHKCYPICEIGDRCVYIVAKDPMRLMQLAQECVASIQIFGSLNPNGNGSTTIQQQQDGDGDDDGPSNQKKKGAKGDRKKRNNTHNSAAHNQQQQQNNAAVVVRNISRAASVIATPRGSRAESFATSASSASRRGINDYASSYKYNNASRVGGHSTTVDQTSEHSSEQHSSFISSTVCMPSGACHAACTPRCYDPLRDTYFYGSTVILGKLGAAVDATVSGEVAWTSAFEDACLREFNLGSASDAFFGALDSSPAKTIEQKKHKHHHHGTTAAGKMVEVSMAGGSTVHFLVGPPTSTNTVTEAGKVTLFIASWDRSVALIVSDGGGDDGGGGAGNRTPRLHGKHLGGPTTDDEGTASASASTIKSKSTVARTMHGGPVVVGPQLSREDDRSNEDPSTAMAILSDAYIKRMCVIASDERKGTRNRRGKGGKNGSSGGSIFGGGSSRGGGGSKNESGAGGGANSSHDRSSGEATAITRSATLLHIAVDGDVRLLADMIRKVVIDERGSIVSAHENIIVCAFNLLSPNGQHQLRAADTVNRLRAVLHPMRFVCSIHFGKVHALVSPEGWVMCSGDVVTVGKLLLNRAIEMSVLMQSHSSASAYSSTLRLASYTPAQNDRSLNADSAAAANAAGAVGGVSNRVAPFHHQFSTTTATATTTVFNNNTNTTVAPSGNVNNTLFAANHALLAGGGIGGGAGRSPNLSTLAMSPQEGDRNNNAPSSVENGLCLLYCHNEVNTMYDCEAVDVTYFDDGHTAAAAAASFMSPPHASAGVGAPLHPATTHRSLFQPAGNAITNTASAPPQHPQSPSGAVTGAASAQQPRHPLLLTKPKVLYRLADISTTTKAADDEWMYQLKAGEDTNIYAAMNAVFVRLAQDDVEEAERLLAKIKSNSNNVGGGGAGNGGGLHGNNTNANNVTVIDDGIGDSDGGGNVSSNSNTTNHRSAYHRSNVDTAAGLAAVLTPTIFELSLPATDMNNNNTNANNNNRVVAAATSPSPTGDGGGQLLTSNTLLGIPAAVVGSFSAASTGGLESAGDGPSHYAMEGLSRLMQQTVRHR